MVALSVTSSYIKLIHKTSKVNNVIVMSKIDISRVKNTFIKRIHINNLINSGIK